MFFDKKNYLNIVCLSLIFISSNVKATDFGTYLHPFAVNSLWNSKPVSTTFSDYVIPNSVYVPTAYTPAFSATCYYTDINDGPTTIHFGPGGGIHDRDSERIVSSIEIPHWPANVIPATGADVIDVENKIIHSFIL